MKKLLLLAAVLTLGTSALAADATSTVRVRAEVTDDALVISDLSGRPLLLDFGKVPKTFTGKANAKIDFKIAAADGTTTFSKFDLKLGGNTSTQTVTLKNAALTSAQTIDAKVDLDRYTSTGTALKEHRGAVLGTIDCASNSMNSKEVGTYEGQVELSVTAS